VLLWIGLYFCNTKVKIDRLQVQKRLRSYLDVESPMRIFFREDGLGLAIKLTDAMETEKC